MILDIILSWFGLTRTTHYEAMCDAWRDKMYKNMKLRSWILELRARTPHSYIKDEINELLEQTSDDVHIHMPD